MEVDADTKVNSKDIKSENSDKDAKKSHIGSMCSQSAGVAPSTEKATAMVNGNLSDSDKEAATSAPSAVNAESVSSIRSSF